MPRKRLEYGVRGKFGNGGKMDCPGPANNRAYRRGSLEDIGLVKSLTDGHAELSLDWRRLLRWTGIMEEWALVGNAPEGL